MLCDAKRVPYTRALIEAGLSKSLYSKWKDNPQAVPNGATLQKLSTYFGVPIDYFCNDVEIKKDPTQTSEVSELAAIINQLNGQNTDIALDFLKVLLEKQGKSADSQD